MFLTSKKLDIEDILVGMREAESILGFSVTNMASDQCIAHMVEWIHRGDLGRYFVCANPHSLMVAMSDGIFQRAFNNADFVIPDGIGVVLASRILGGKIHDRVTGFDVFQRLSEKLNGTRRFSYFFMGSTNVTLMKICEQMKTDFPNIRVAGVFSPPFKAELDEDDEDFMVGEVNRVEPDVLWLGMTAPKQEKFIYRNRHRLHVKFIGPVGAVFDFYAGTVSRSNPFFLKHGLEWLPRLMKEPSRLWRRNIVSAPVFLARVIKKRIELSK